MALSSERFHPGLGSGSGLRTHQHRCECGELFPIEVVVAVDTQKDAALAARVNSVKDARDLNQSVCPACGTACFAEASAFLRRKTQTPSARR